MKCRLLNGKLFNGKKTKIIPFYISTEMTIFTFNFSTLHCFVVRNI